ncbi:hypothetical protein LINPERHAP1_LOCUS20031 [Linum perenne]
MEAILVMINFEGCFAVDALGHSGGIFILWKNKDQVKVIRYKNNNIHVEVEERQGEKFVLTGYYGYLERTRRRESWALLKTIANSIVGWWCCIGDYNDFLSADEKRGRRDHPPALIQGFRKATNECGLTDIRLDEYKYTWARSKGTPNAIEERLDRAMVNGAWSTCFPESTLRNLNAPISDHSLILLNTHQTVRTVRSRRFRFENKWLTEEGVKGIVEEGWRRRLI